MHTLSIYLEERFVSFNGEYYSLVYDDTFWQRYLDVFDSIDIIARVKEVNTFEDVQKGYNKVTSKSIKFISLPYYHGTMSGIIKLPYLLAKISLISLRNRHHLLRLPGPISMIAGLCLSFLPRKFIAVELVGDPYDVFSTGIGGRLSKPLGFVFTSMTKFVIKKASAVSYVTEFTLQKRYPASSDAYTTHYSSIVLEKGILRSDNIRNNINKERFNILLVGSMEQRYKGFDLVIKAIGLLDFKDKVILNIVGDGIFKDELIELAAEEGLSENVIFHGKLSRNQVFDIMKRCDLFIMPSRTEGLPRALIEAMATGLPAIGSNVGGIPELLDKGFIFKSENTEELSKLIVLIYDYDDISQISRRNFLKAQEYSDDILQQRRAKFYNYVMDQE